MRSAFCRNDVEKVAEEKKEHPSFSHGNESKSMT